MDALRNAFTSAGEGGSPVRSKVTRRISVRASAVLAGASFCAASLRTMKGSISFFAQPFP
jgi:hypothetical protein